MDDKSAVLLAIWQEHNSGLRTTVDRENRYFRWATTLLIIVMGFLVIIGSVKLDRMPSTLFRILMTVSLVLPVLVTIVLIFRRSRQAVRNTQVIERIEPLLHLFDQGVYGEQSPLPEQWKGHFSEIFQRRKTPLYYGFTLLILCACTVVGVWMI